jgi:hypothetical protein
MMQFLRRSISSGVIIALFITACATTQLTSSWKDPSYIAESRFAAAVDADWQWAGELRITAVPTHLCGGKRLAGFSDYNDFVSLISKG